MTASARVRPRGMAGILGACRTRPRSPTRSRPCAPTRPAAPSCSTSTASLAPIVRHADDAHVPEPTRDAAHRHRQALRPRGLRDAAARPPTRGGSSSLGSIAYVGNHGAEILRGGATEPSSSTPRSRPGRRASRTSRPRALERPRRCAACACAGEDKDVDRRLPLARRARRGRRRARGRARSPSGPRRTGWCTHWGRKVLEVRPPVRLDKGRGVAQPARRRRPRRRALRRATTATDLDAFARAAPPRGRRAGSGRAVLRRRALGRDPAGARGRGRPARRRAARACAQLLQALRGLTRALRRLPQDGRPAQRRPRRRCSPSITRRRRRRPTTTRRSSRSPPAWWVVAAAIGALVGRRAQVTPPIARAAGRREVDDERCPSCAPAPCSSTGSGRCCSRRWPRPCSASVFPQVAAVATGFALIWSLGWRHQDAAVAAIEERDGVTFYVERTSPVRPIRLVRTPGFRREVPDAGRRRR